MDSKEKFGQMEVDFQSQDDNTSCSSSHSTSVSEDMDELRLGAEAQSFASNHVEGQEPRKRVVQTFLIMKETPHAHDDRTFSTISNISDLIDAREVDPDDLLLGLGFVPYEGEESHNSILKRFKQADDNVCTRGLQPSHVLLRQDPQAHDGIAKTKEWLARQSNINTAALSTQPSENPNGAKTKESLNHHTHIHAKRISTQRKRHRWSKSRQSSFEHLLPNLEEEEPGRDAYRSDDNGDITQVCTKRLLERDTFQETQYSNATPTDEKLNKLLCKKSSDDDICRSLQYPTQRLLKLHELVKVKLDSFELEEIASNDGFQSFEITPPFDEQLRRLQVSSNAGMLDIYSAELGLVALSPRCSALTKLRRSSSTEDFSETTSNSSSGFDEGLEESVPFLNDYQHSPKKNESTSTTCTRIATRLGKFCSIRAKIACAGGVAEAALRLRKLKMQHNGNVSKYGICHCADSSVRTFPLDLNNFQDHEVRQFLRSSCILGRSIRYAKLSTLSLPDALRTGAINERPLHHQYNSMKCLQPMAKAHQKLMSSIVDVTNLSAKTTVGQCIQPVAGDRTGRSKSIGSIEALHCNRMATNGFGTSRSASVSCDGTDLPLDFFGLCFQRSLVMVKAKTAVGSTRSGVGNSSGPFLGMGHDYCGCVVRDSSQPKVPSCSSDCSIVVEYEPLAMSDSFAQSKAVALLATGSSKDDFVAMDSKGNDGSPSQKPSNVVTRCTKNSSDLFMDCPCCGYHSSSSYN